MKGRGIATLALLMLAAPAMAQMDGPATGSGGIVAANDAPSQAKAGPATAPAGTLPAPSPGTAKGATALPAASSTCPSCAGCSQDCFADCCGCAPGGFYGGVGFYFLKPHFSSNPAFASSTVAGGNATLSNLSSISLTSVPSLISSLGSRSDTITPFSYDYSFSPRVWLGYTASNGWGARTSFWNFAQGSNPLVLNNTNPTFLGLGGTRITSAAPMGQFVQSNPLIGDLAATLGSVAGATLSPSGMAFDSNLRLSVWDFEGTWGQSGTNGNYLVSAGARYAHISQDFNAYRIRTDSFPDGTVFTGAQSLLSGHNFNGAGPTASVQGSYRLGGSGFSLYGNGRGSLLFGGGQQQALLINGVSANNSAGLGGIAGPIATALSNVNSASTVEQNRIIPVLEAELGVQWSYDIGQRSNFFIRAGVVGMAWFNVGNAANSDTIPATINLAPLLPTATTVNNNSNLGLFGFTLTTGFLF